MLKPEALKHSIHFQLACMYVYMHVMYVCMCVCVCVCVCMYVCMYVCGMYVWFPRGACFGRSIAFTRLFAPAPFLRHCEEYQVGWPPRDIVFLDTYCYLGYTFEELTSF